MLIVLTHTRELSWSILAQAGQGQPSLLQEQYRGRPLLMGCIERLQPFQSIARDQRLPNDRLSCSSGALTRLTTQAKGLQGFELKQSLELMGAISVLPVPASVSVRLCPGSVLTQILTSVS